MVDPGKPEQPGQRSPSAGIRLASLIGCIGLLSMPLLAQRTATGRRIDLTSALQLGSGQFAQLFIPDYYVAPFGGAIDLVIHLHGASWAAEDEVYRSRRNAVLFNIHLGGFSSAYQGYFVDQSRFRTILNTVLASLESNGIISHPSVRFLILTSFSAGYAGVREMLKSASYYARVDALTLADGLHCNSDSAAMRGQMQDFVRYAKDARDRVKVMLLTHSSIPTPGYQSTTQTADYLLQGIGGKRTSRVLSDEIGTLYSVCDTGHFHLRGYLGETAPDHLKHLYAMHLLADQAESLLQVQELGVLQYEAFPAGTHRVVWDARGRPSGVYFCRLEAAGLCSWKKVTLLR